MKHFFIQLTILFCGINLQAQTAEDSVKQVVSTLFSAMKKADSTLLKSCFADNMLLQTITHSKEGNTVVNTESVAKFASSIGQLSAGDADEQIVFATVKIDGPLAMVWTPYKFYFKGKFSHCGVNSFQLVRYKDIWKIQYIIDTRRRSGCGEF